MPTKLGQRQKTKKPLDWCRPPIKKPPVIAGTPPTSLLAQVLFNANAGPASQPNLSFYFPDIPATAPGEYEAIAQTGNWFCYLYLTLDWTQKTLQAAAYLTDGSTDYATIESSPGPIDPRRPIEKTFEQFAFVIPDDQRGRIKVWQ